MTERNATPPGDPTHEPSGAPPSPLPPSPSPSPSHPTRQDTLPGIEAVTQWPWAAPADNDFSATATAWRAAKALSRTERQKEVNAEFRASLDKLRETIDAGLEFLSTLASGLKWAARILGGAGILGAGAAFAHWLLTLHH